MTLKIYNSLTRQKQEFKPEKSGKVRFYTCGVTVYDDCHIGHARSLYTFEVIRRYLKYRGFKVKFIRNITDIDDKIIKRAAELGMDWQKLVDKYIASYRRDLAALAIPEADKEPRATENIAEMIKYIANLIKKGYAYSSQSGVYFSVRKLKNYGKLSGQATDEMRNAVRIESEEDKQDPLDFALWKKAKAGEPSWMSPWGRGRPGWHIECSAMSRKYLKTDTFDIHGGGRDLIFPHHENESAQAEALTEKPFANYWIHHGLLTINGQKMAKSLGNFVTIQDVLTKYPADALKLFYLGAHYSSSVDFSWERMIEAKKAYETIDILLSKLKKIKNPKFRINFKAKNLLAVDKFRQQFVEAMDDDFNTARALAVLFDLINQTNRLIDSPIDPKELNLQSIQRLIYEISAVFVLTFSKPEISSDQAKLIDQKIKLRLEYKAQKKFAEADKIREQLEAEGIILEDTKEGTTWRKKI